MHHFIISFAFAFWDVPFGPEFGPIDEIHFDVRDAAVPCGPRASERRINVKKLSTIEPQARAGRSDAGLGGLREAAPMISRAVIMSAYSARTRDSGRSPSAETIRFDGGTPGACHRVGPSQ